MPIARVQLPDGRIAKLEVAEGTTPQQVEEFVASQLSQQQPQPQTPKSGGFDEEKFAAGLNPTNDMTGGELMRAGIGRRFHNAGQAVGQLFGGSDEQIAQSKTDDKALLGTNWGKAGDFVGTVGLLAPTSFIPGANTYTGAALIGGLSSALTTTGDAKERLEAGAWGAAGGVAGKGTGDLISKGARAHVARAAANKVANASRDAVLAEGRAMGLVVPPATANGNLLNKTVEGFAGKLSTAQKASNMNVGKIDELAKADVGLRPDDELTTAALGTIRKNAGKAYAAIESTGIVTPGAQYSAAIDKLLAPFQRSAAGFPNAKPGPVIADLDALKSPQFDASAAVAKISELRDLASAAYKGGSAQAGRAYKGAAKALEDALDDHLVTIGAPKGMIDAYRGARELIAKTYSLEKAMEGSNVSAAKLATMLKAGKKLSGNMEKLARFASDFPKAVQSTAKVGTIAGTSPLDWAGAGIAALHNPAFAAGVFARPAARNMLLSRPYQAIATTPNRAPNKLAQLAIPAMENRVTQNALRVSGSSYGSQE